MNPWIYCCLSDSGLTNGGSYNNINSFSGGGSGGYSGFKTSGIYSDTIRKPTRLEALPGSNHTGRVIHGIFRNFVGEID